LVFGGRYDRGGDARSCTFPPSSILSWQSDEKIVARAVPHKVTLPDIIEDANFPDYPDTKDVGMIDFYALTSPNVQKIYIMLEETKLPYKEHFIDVWQGDQFNPDFLKINPNAKIPAIVDHEGPAGKPYPVFESGAILMCR
jgi:Glutathione S-transferase, N-terminal domain